MFRLWAVGDVSCTRPSGASGSLWVIWRNATKWKVECGMWNVKGGIEREREREREERERERREERERERERNS